MVTLNDEQEEDDWVAVFLSPVLSANIIYLY